MSSRHQVNNSAELSSIDDEFTDPFDDPFDTQWMKRIPQQQPARPNASSAHVVSVSAAPATDSMPLERPLLAIDPFDTQLTKRIPQQQPARPNASSAHVVTYSPVSVSAAPATDSAGGDGGAFAKAVYTAHDAIEFSLQGFDGNYSSRTFNFSLNSSVFLFEFFTQLLFPLSLPIVIMYQNVNAARNKGFLPGMPAFGLEIFGTLTLYLPLGFACYAAKDHYWGLYAVSISFSLGIFRKLVIAGKYASFKPEKYAQVLEPKTDIMLDLLIPSWGISLEKDLLLQQVNEAQRDAMINLEDQYFTLYDGSTQLSAKTYLCHLVEHSYKMAPPWAGKVIALSTLGLSLLPVWLFVEEEKNKKDAKSIILLILTLGQSFVYGNAVFTFLAIGVMHYWRMMRLQLFHANVLGLSGMPTDSNAVSIPASIPMNLVVWTSVRSVIQNFARTYTTRVSCNFFAALVISGNFVLILLQQFLSESKSFELIAILSYIFVWFTICIVVAILMGYRANRSASIALKLLHDEQFAFVWRSMHPPAAEDGDGVPAPYGFACLKGKSQAVARLSDEEAWRDAFDVVKDTLEQANEHQPLIVMFVPASPELLSVVISVFISGITLLAGVVLSGVDLL